MSEGEEKTEEPSARKLKKARDDGQVATYKDFITAVGSAILFSYVLTQISSMFETMQNIFISTFMYSNETFDESLSLVLPTMIQSSFAIIIPFGFIAFITTTVITLILNGGIVFSTKPLVPDIKRINPASGLKKLFDSKAFIELGKSVIKLIILGSAMSLTALVYLNDLVRSPVCGIECLPAMLKTMVKPILLVSLGIFIALAILDLPLQKFLFIKEQKSTKSEVKREHKEQDGSPELRRERKRLEREIANMPDKIGLKNSSFMIFDNDACIGLRYVKGETQIPHVTCRAKTPEMLIKMMGASDQLQIRKFRREDLAKNMAKKMQVGSALPKEFFDPVIQILREGQYI